MFKAEDHIAAINTFRIALNGKSFSKETLKKTFKNIGIPTNEIFLKEFSKTLISLNKDEYRFKDDPMHFRVLDRVYKDYHSKANTYQQTYRRKIACLSYL